MVVKFFLTDFKLKDKEKRETERAVAELISFYAQYIGLSSTYLHNIILADDPNFAKAIHSIDKSAKTKKVVLSETVKVLNHEVEKNVMRCSLVVRNELMDILLAAQAKPPSKWSLAEKSFRYSLMHALGLCLDIMNRNRPLTPEHRPIKNFSVQEIFQVYQNRLLREFAASFFAGKGLEPEVFNNNQTAICKSFTKQFDTINQEKQNYAGNPKSLFHLAHTAASFFWVTLVHYAGLIGNRLNNEKISMQPLHIWQNGSELTLALIQEMEKHLCALWDAYPDWSPEDSAFLLNIWKFLAIEHGFKFVESPRGDGLLWK